jgi:pimeloyl-ACP methyl ester carboxylesterase
MKLVLLPGMDGTGELFKDFVAALPEKFETQVVRYPVNECLSYEALAEFVRRGVPVTEPFLLVAESFSTPVAVQCAAGHPSNLKGLVLAAGFVASPVNGWRRAVCLGLARILFRVKLAGYAARAVLVGKTAPNELVAAVQAAVSSVKPTVLAARVRSVLSCDVRAELGLVAAPILYVQAGQDRFVSGASLEEIRGIQPQVVVEVVDGPHLLLQREPRRTAEIVARFAGELGKGSRSGNATLQKLP